MESSVVKWIRWEEMEVSQAISGFISIALMRDVEVLRQRRQKHKTGTWEEKWEGVSD